MAFETLHSSQLSLELVGLGPEPLPKESELYGLEMDLEVGDRSQIGSNNLATGGRLFPHPVNKEYIGVINVVQKIGLNNI